MTIKILTTGGTIDKLYFDAASDYRIGEPQVIEILREAGVTLDYVVESILRKDSLEMTDADRQAVRRAVLADAHERFLITHGTDTMAQTAAALDDIPDKVIVLTGAMQPARFRITDAIFNVGYALAAAQLSPPGVYIAMHGRTFAAGQTRKNRERGRFEAIE